MRLTCLVENCVAQGSTLWGEHGLAFLIEAKGVNILWDTGQSGDVLRHNLKALGLEAVRVDIIALSHAHYDHTGGLEAAWECFPQARGFAHPAILEPRYALREGKRHPIGLNDGIRERLVSRASLSAAPTMLAEDVWTSGEIRTRPFPEGRSAHHMAWRGGEAVPDDYRDDLSLILKVPGGIVLLCGCCHAGLRNVLLTVHGQYREEPLLAVIGGTHLINASSEELAALVETLRALGSPRLYMNHCTGDRAHHRLAQAFGEAVQGCPAGTVLTF